MRKLNDLNEKIVKWYFEEIKEKVNKRIEECRDLFEGDLKIVDNNEILECLNKIKRNLREYIIGDETKSLVTEKEMNKNITIPFNLKKLLYSDKKKFLKKRENIFRQIKCQKKNLKLEKQLKILKKIFENKSKNGKKEKYKLKWKHFLMYIFDYDILDSQKDKVTLRNRLLSEMNVKTCPYCDRQYITNYDNNYSTADLDHFYSQSEYPYLALNIYNFIPACAVCNRNFKKTKELGINPRIEGFGENAVFTLGNRINTFMDMQLEDIDIKLNIKVEGDLKDRIEKNKDTFKLEEVYKTHNDYILQMIKDITFRGNESYLESIKEFFPEDSKDKAIEKLRNLIKEPYKFKIREEEPLGKLTKDVLNELEEKM